MVCKLPEKKGERERIEPPLDQFLTDQVLLIA